MSEPYDPDSFEARLERSLGHVKVLAKEARAMLRTLGPRQQILSERHRAYVRDPDEMAASRCTVCESRNEPRVYTCRMCDWETTDRWRYTVHVDLFPKWCADRAKAKADRYARSG